METIKIKWLINHKAWDKNWNLLFDETFPNTITNTWKAELANLAWNVSSPASFTYLANWTSATAAAATQTALIWENANTYWFWRAAATVTRQTTTSTNDTLQLIKLWTATWDVVVNEIWIFNDATTGIMLWRQVLWATKNFWTWDTYQVTYKIIFA